MTPAYIAFGIAAVCIVILIGEGLVWGSNQRY